MNPKRKRKRGVITIAFIIMVLILLLGLIFSFLIMNRSKIGGELYDEIMLSDELVADILPPSEYIVESYAVALEYMWEFSDSRREELYLRFMDLRDTYYERHDYWKDKIPEKGTLRKYFLQNSYNSAVQFYEIFDEEVVPAVKSGDSRKIYQSQLTLRAAYYSHRNAVNASVSVAKIWQNDTFESSYKLSERNGLLVIVLILILVGLSIPIGVFIFRSERKLLEMSYYDGLTGLPNRRQIISRLEALVNSSASDRFSVAYFDLDHFKSVNDKLGHDAGDTLLREVTASLLTVRHPEDFLGRLGGDEFVLLISRNLSVDEINSYLGVLQEKVRSVNQIHDQTIKVSASFGVAVYPEDGKDPSELLKHSDKAMYEMKRAGGNGVRLYGRHGYSSTQNLI